MRRRYPEYSIRQPNEQYSRSRIIRRATPNWADKVAIDKVYSEAKSLTKQTGILHSVDHLIPLGGKNVCGLHVDYNLEVLPWIDNVRKGNKFV